MAEIFLNNISLGDFKGVLFDKDGTLTSSKSNLRDIANSRVREIKKILKNKLIKNELNQLIKLLKSAYGLTENLVDPNGLIAIASRQDNLISTATLISIFTKSWPEAIDISNKVFQSADKDLSDLESIAKERPLFKGVKILLDKLVQANIKCAVISNDTSKGIKDFLDHNKIANQFAGYWSCENNPPKPNPTAVIKLCKSIDLHPHECMLIGDSDLDLKMAQQAGIGISIGYVSGWDIKPDISYQNKLISKWEELSCH
ncbi:HAD-IA family hydrolase [Prochlorococcus sp. MIT 1223]|uniref:HAD family hydrolase n=1 Tax=Prochlorococcus sp. MIT 1223 TaxID=3096217 RepID=UPI002A75B7BF|nr:HAD-IA family hydrolase [Prochlorococcus sp. MIT 1223]